MLLCACVPRSFDQPLMKQAWLDAPFLPEFAARHIILCLCQNPGITQQCMVLDLHRQREARCTQRWIGMVPLRIAA